MCSTYFRLSYDAGHGATTSAHCSTCYSSGGAGAEFAMPLYGTGWRTSPPNSDRPHKWHTILGRKPISNRLE